MGTGLVLTSQVDRLWLGYVTYGIGVGVAVACGYVPMVAVVGGWFERRRSAAIGIAVAGIGLGTLLVSPLAAAAIERWGWRSTYIGFAIVATSVLLVCAWFIAPPPKSEHAQAASSVRSVAGRATRSREFVILYISGFIGSLALFSVFVFLVPYAQDEGIAEVKAATLISIVGGASIVGRIGLSALGDRVGRIRIYQVSFFVMALSYPIWGVAGDSYGVLVVFALAMGAGYGGFIALSPAVAAELFGTDGMGRTVGTLYTSAGVGALIGPPLAGWLVDTHGYRPMIVVAGVLAAVATVTLVPLGRPTPAPDSQAVC